jgi:hypothetical protein
MSFRIQFIAIYLVPTNDIFLPRIVSYLNSTVNFMFLIAKLLRDIITIATVVHTWNIRSR